MKNLNSISVILLAALTTGAYAAEKISVSSARSVGSYISLRGQGNNTYEASNVIDGKLNTTWAAPYEEGKDYVLQLTPATAGTEVTEILINNGYGKDSKSFTNNSRAKEISIYVNGQNKENLIQKVTLKDQMEQQVVTIPATKNVEAIFIKIESIYKGKKWSDLCISEIGLQGAILQVTAPAVGEVLKDSRDGQTYKTVVIDGKTWMAQNLNFATSTGVSWCYDDKAENCKKYGRLYNWKAAMSACPAGWHLPSKNEFESLVKFVGGIDLGGRKLKSTKGWLDNGGVATGNGTDEFGFNAVPAGIRVNDEQMDGFDRMNYATYFWSTTNSTFGDDEAFNLSVGGSSDKAVLAIDPKETTGMSVRCVK